MNIKIEYNDKVEMKVTSQFDHEDIYNVNITMAAVLLVLMREYAIRDGIVYPILDIDFKDITLENVKTYDKYEVHDIIVNKILWSLEQILRNANQEDPLCSELSIDPDNSYLLMCTVEGHNSVVEGLKLLAQNMLYFYL